MSKTQQSCTFKLAAWFCTMPSAKLKTTNKVFLSLSFSRYIFVIVGGRCSAVVSHCLMSNWFRQFGPGYSGSTTESQQHFQLHSFNSPPLTPSETLFFLQEKRHDQIVLHPCAVEHLTCCLSWRKWGSHQTLIQIKTHRQQGMVWLSCRLNKN